MAVFFDPDFYESKTPPKSKKPIEQIEATDAFRINLIQPQHLTQPTLLNSSSAGLDLPKSYSAGVDVNPNVRFVKQVMDYFQSKPILLALLEDIGPILQAESNASVRSTVRSTSSPKLEFDFAKSLNLFNRIRFSNFMGFYCALFDGHIKNLDKYNNFNSLHEGNSRSMVSEYVLEDILLKTLTQSKKVVKQQGWLSFWGNPRNPPVVPDGYLTKIIKNFKKNATLTKISIMFRSQSLLVIQNAFQTTTPEGRQNDLAISICLAFLFIRECTIKSTGSPSINIKYEDKDKDNKDKEAVTSTSLLQLRNYFIAIVSKLEMKLLTKTLKIKDCQKLEEFVNIIKKKEIQQLESWKTTNRRNDVDNTVLTLSMTIYDRFVNKIKIWLLLEDQSRPFEFLFYYKEQTQDYQDKKKKHEKPQERAQQENEQQESQEHEEEKEEVKTIQHKSNFYKHYYQDQYQYQLHDNFSDEIFDGPDLPIASAPIISIVISKNPLQSNPFQSITASNESKSVLVTFLFPDSDDSRDSPDNMLDYIKKTLSFSQILQAIKDNSLHQFLVHDGSISFQLFTLFVLFTKSTTFQKLLHNYKHTEVMPKFERKEPEDSPEDSKDSKDSIDVKKEQVSKVSKLLTTSSPYIVLQKLFASDQLFACLYFFETELNLTFGNLLKLPVPQMIYSSYATYKQNQHHRLFDINLTFNYLTYQAISQSVKQKGQKKQQQKKQEDGSSQRRWEHFTEFRRSEEYNNYKKQRASRIMNLAYEFARINIDIVGMFFPKAPNIVRTESE